MRNLSAKEDKYAVTNRNLAWAESEESSESYEVFEMVA
jgi:hypothetical protein